MILIKAKFWAFLHSVFYLHRIAKDRTFKGFTYTIWCHDCGKEFYQHKRESLIDERSATVSR